MVQIRPSPPQSSRSDILCGLCRKSAHTNYYVKRALEEFLDRKVHLLGDRRTHVNGVPTLDEISRRTFPH